MRRSGAHLVLDCQDYCAAVSRRRVSPAGDRRAVELGVEAPLPLPVGPLAPGMRASGR